VGTDPGVDVLGKPDLAVPQIRNGLREIDTAGDLVRPLPTDTAEPDADLVSTYKVQPRRCNTPDYSP
jgi:hypothetical protein